MTSDGGRTLSRDFKHVKRHTPGGASHAFNGWVGLSVGLAVGLSVALGVFLHYRGPPAAEPKREPARAPQSAKASDDSFSAEAPANPEHDLTFYDLLKNQKVAVPGDAAVKPGAAKAVLPKGDAMLQAGSFKQEAEAEKMQAKLALAGVQSKVQRFPMDDETWYRVRIGPIATVQELESIENKLNEAEIEYTRVASVAEPPRP